MANIDWELKGTTKHYIWTNEWQKIYLSAPSWDCGWYWGFGYLWNRNCHYHLSGLNEGKNQSLYDAIKEHFEDLQITNNKLWVFCELVSTAYKLKEAAEVLRSGGSNYTTNPLKELIKNEEETKRINEIILPAIFLEIEKCFITEEDRIKLKELTDKKAELEEKLKNVDDNIKEIREEKYKIQKEIDSI